MRKLFQTILFSLLLPVPLMAQKDIMPKNFGASEFGFHSLDTIDQGSKVLAPSTHKSDVVDCHTDYLADSLGNQFRNFATSLESISSVSACMGITNDPPASLRFSEKRCKMLTECSWRKIDNDSNVPSSSVSKLMSEDYVRVKVDQEIGNMEELEKLRRFAEKKFGSGFASACNSPYDYDSKKLSATAKCNVTVMDNAFLRLQDKCQATSSSCFNSGTDPQKEYKAFMSNYHPADEGHSSMQSFLVQRAENAVNESLANDNEEIEVLAQVMSSKGKTSDKMTELFSKLSEFKKQGKLDPVFGYENGTIGTDASLYKKSPHYDFFSKILSKPMDMASARSAIEKHRLEMAKKALASFCPKKGASKAAGFTEICANATDVYQSKKVSLFDREKAARIISEDKDDDRFEVIKNLYPNGVKTKEDYKIIMDANRCKAFNFSADIVSEGVSNWLKKNDRGRSLFKDSIYDSYVEGTSTPSDRGVSRVSSDRDYSRFVDSKMAPSPSNPSGSSPVNAIAPKSAGADQIKSADNAAITSKFTAGLKDSLGNSTTNNYLNNSGFQNYAHSMIQDGQNDRSKNSEVATDESKKTAAKANAVLNDKISELSRKLSSTEENLDRLKKEKEAADAENAQQKKMEEDSKTIVDLKNQINDLKNQTAKTETASASDKGQDKSSAVSGNSGTLSNQVASNEGNSKESTFNRENRGGQEEQAQAPTRSVSSAMAQDNSSVSNSRAPASASTSSQLGGSKSGLILTKIDGLTAENAMEAINDKIIELDGRPFYIEEGGMVKEIVPLMKDGKIQLNESGKPLFTKVVKGKVGDKKFAQEKIKKEQREPASITDAADLKRSEEEKMKRERAEYLKLKNITNQVIEKK